MEDDIIQIPGKRTVFKTQNIPDILIKLPHRFYVNRQDWWPVLDFLMMSLIGLFCLFKSVHLTNYFFVNIFCFLLSFFALFICLTNLIYFIKMQFESGYIEFTRQGIYDSRWGGRQFDWVQLDTVYLDTSLKLQKSYVFLGIRYKNNQKFSSSIIKIVWNVDFIRSNEDRIGLNTFSEFDTIVTLATRMLTLERNSAN